MKKETIENNKEEFLKSLENTLKRSEGKIKNLSEKMANSTSDAKASLSHALKDGQKKYQKAEKIFQSLKGATADNWEEIKSQASDIFDELHKTFNEVTDNFSWSQVNHMTEEAMDYGQEKLEELSDCIRKKPFTSALWAFGIGFVLGKILRSK